MGVVETSERRRSDESWKLTVPIKRDVPSAFASGGDGGGSGEGDAGKGGTVGGGGVAGGGRNGGGGEGASSSRVPVVTSSTDSTAMPRVLLRLEVSVGIMTAMLLALAASSAWIVARILVLAASIVSEILLSATSRRLARLLTMLLCAVVPAE